MKLSSDFTFFELNSQHRSFRFAAQRSVAELNKWIKEGLASRKANIDKVGIAYMYMGAWVTNKSGSDRAIHKEFHVAPHIMIITPHQEELQ